MLVRIILCWLGPLPLFKRQAFLIVHFDAGRVYHFFFVLYRQKMLQTWRKEHSSGQVSSDESDDDEPQRRRPPRADPNPMLAGGVVWVRF